MRFADAFSEVCEFRVDLDGGGRFFQMVHRQPDGHLLRIFGDGRKGCECGYPLSVEREH